MPPPTTPVFALPKLAAVIDTYVLLPGDILQYSNGACVACVHKQAAKAYVFNRVNGERLVETHQGPEKHCECID